MSIYITKRFINSVITNNYEVKIVIEKTPETSGELEVKLPEKRYIIYPFDEWGWVEINGIWTHTITGTEKLVVHYPDGREETRVAINERAKKKIFKIYVDECRWKNDSPLYWVCGEEAISKILKLTKPE